MTHHHHQQYGGQNKDIFSPGEIRTIPSFDFHVLHFLSEDASSEIATFSPKLTAKPTMNFTQDVNKPSHAVCTRNAS